MTRYFFTDKNNHKIVHYYMNFIRRLIETRDCERVSQSVL
jgi:hypothetical protein